MSNHLVAVLCCWLVSLCGLAMFVRAKGTLGKVAGHFAVVVAMLSLSAMALDHEHSAKGRESFYVAEVGKPVYHAPGCPIAKRDVVFRSEDEAWWAGKTIPCTFCLLHQAEEHPAGE